MSPLHTNLQVVNFQNVNMGSHGQSCKLVHTSGVTCIYPLQVAVFLCTLLHGTVQDTVLQNLYFKLRLSRSKHKSSGDVAGMTVLF